MQYISTLCKMSNSFDSNQLMSVYAVDVDSPLKGRDPSPWWNKLVAE